ncbi:MAG: hypothetical protein ACOC06_06265 [Halorubrum sp.]
MSVKDPPVLSNDDLNDTDRSILELLRNGRVTPPYVASELDKSREYASERLIRMLEHGHATRVAPGLYELVDDPRDGVEPPADPDALQDRIDELETSLADARGDVEYYKGELRKCREQLDQMPDRQAIKRAIDDLEAALANGGMDVEVAFRRLREAAGVADE